MAFVAKAQNEWLPGQFIVQNHGVDYPVKGNYEYGKYKITDEKLIRDNQYQSLLYAAGNTYNGIVVVALYPNPYYEGKYILYKPRTEVTVTNGVHQFDWHLKDTANVHINVVEKFLEYLDGLPEGSIVFMLSGYYHGINKMDETFYKAMEALGSTEVRNLKKNDVWVFYGTNCESQVAPKEIVTSRSDTLIKLAVNVYNNCEPTSIQNTEYQQVNVYPNPFNETLTINNVKGLRQVTIVSITGKEFVRTKKSGQIDVSTLPKGVYLVRIETETKTYTSKLLKN